MGVNVRFWKGAWWVFVNHQGHRKAKRVGDRETAIKVAQAIRERIVRAGLRLGELLGLQWGDVDLNSRFLTIRRNLVRGLVTTPKSHQQRRVDVSQQLHDALLAWRRHERKRWLKKGKPMPATVFTARGDGAALDDANVRHVLTRILEKAELRHIRIHDLRHTFASLLIQNGESLAYVKDQMGHASIQITVDTYGHLVPGGNRAAVDRLDDEVPAQPPTTQAQPEPGQAPRRSLVSCCKEMVSRVLLRDVARSCVASAGLGEANRSFPSRCERVAQGSEGW